MIQCIKGVAKYQTISVNCLSSIYTVVAFSFFTFFTSKKKKTNTQTFQNVQIGMCLWLSLIFRIFFFFIAISWSAPIIKQYFESRNYFAYYLSNEIVQFSQFSVRTISLVITFILICLDCIDCSLRFGCCQTKWLVCSSCYCCSRCYQDCPTTTSGCPFM